jgi:hypothetical protein
MHQGKRKSGKADASPSYETTTKKTLALVLRPSIAKRSDPDASAQIRSIRFPAFVV